MFGGGWATTLPLAIALVAAVAMIVVKFSSTETSGISIRYATSHYFHEGADWDAEHNRVLLSIFFDGGIYQIGLNGSDPGSVVRAETVVVPSKEKGGPVWVGLRVDPPRRRVLVVIAHMNKNYSALAAYDWESWERLFLTKLAGPETVSFADDAAVDEDGNAYVTDTTSTRIWKVSPDGSKATVLTNSPLLRLRSPLPFESSTLNGVVYHPDGYLLVGHTWAGGIIKISTDGTTTHRVTVTGNLLMVDGIALLSPDKLVTTSVFGTRLVETTDGWETARVTHKFTGPWYRLGTSVFVKDGRPFTSYGLGFGIGQKHGHIQEAIFQKL